MPDTSLWDQRRLKRSRRQAHDLDKTAQPHAPTPAMIQRALADPQQMAPQEVLMWQRLVGNQAVSHMLDHPSPNTPPAPARTVQRALHVGAAHDPFEAEADRIAGQVSAAKGSSAPSPESDFGPKIGLEGGTVDAPLAHKINTAKQGGMPLSAQIRRAVEPALGLDLGHVRVHNHDKSHQVTQEMGARAATHGSHILLGRGQSPHDTRLMAHELTHVAQQSQAGGPSGGIVQRDVMSAEEWKTFSTVSGKNGKDKRRSGKLKAIDKALAAWHTNKSDPKKRVSAAGKLKEKILAWQYSKTDKSGQINSSRKIEVAFLLDELDDEINSMPIGERLQVNYGIKLDNEAGKKAIQSDYKDARKDVREGLVTKDWTDDELSGLEGALSNYKGMLGPARRAKGIKGQPVTTFSRLKQGIDEDDNTGEYELDTSTAGETFTKHKNISMFDEGKSIKDFASDKSAPTPEELRKGWQGTIEHEMSHALVEKKAIGKWVKTMDFWVGRYRAAYDTRTEARNDGVEPPPTDYGASNANEDLAESMMFYFQDPTTLSTSYPIRYQFIQDNIAPLLQ